MRQYSHCIWHHTLHICICVFKPNVSMISHTLYAGHHMYYTYGTICTIYGITPKLYDITMLYLCDHTDCMDDMTHTVCRTSHVLNVWQNMHYMWHHTHALWHHILLFMTSKLLYLTSQPLYLTAHQRYLCHHPLIIDHITPILCKISQPKYVWHHRNYIWHHISLFMTCHSMT